VNDLQMQRWFGHRSDEAVMVVGRDYVYHGWIVAVFHKRKEKGGWRCVVEDKHGRLFIQSSHELAETKS
jgi:hypothetical protein